MLCQKLIFFPRVERKRHMRSAPSMVRLGEDLDVGFYSNMKVSLTFSTVRWLLILVAFLQAADGTARPVDIYKLIRLRAMAFYKEKRLQMSHQTPDSTAEYNTGTCFCFQQTEVNLSREGFMLSLFALQESVIIAFSESLEKLAKQVVALKLENARGFTSFRLPLPPPEGAHCSNVIRYDSIYRYDDEALDSSHE